MKIIVCLDDGLGMMFNHRRQSRDRVVIADIAELTRGHRLYIDGYSEKLFADSGAEYAVCGEMLESAGDNDFCFVENKSLLPYTDRIDEIVVYRWNRKYPADLFFDIDLERAGFAAVEHKEFEGYSHEKITKEIFKR